MSSYDPDDPSNQLTQGGGNGGSGGTNQSGGSRSGSGSYSTGHGNYIAPPTLGSQRKFMVGGGGGSQKVATISQNYNEKTMLLSSDDECQ